MSASKTLDRLLRIRALEEEQRRASLESALGELDALRRARATSLETEKQGRARVTASAASAETIDRHAALVEVEAARARSRVLAPRIFAAELETSQRRQAFLDKRVERRQTGTLVEAAEARQTIESDQRSQQAADDWYGARRGRTSPEARSRTSPSADIKKS
jgi:hypothetical protein